MKKLAMFSLAWISLALGVLGIFLPLLPTTPFILVAAYGFSKSSERFHQWLLNHKVFGRLVRDWESSGVIRLNAKILATVSIVVMLSISFYFVQLSIMPIVMILLSVTCVMIFIWTRPSMPKDAKQ